MRDSYFEVTVKDGIDIVLSDSKKRMHTRKKPNSFISLAATNWSDSVLEIGTNRAGLVKRQQDGCDATRVTVETG